MSLRPGTRAAITAVAVTVVIAIGLAIRSLIAFGVFDAVTPAYAGSCHEIRGVAGAQDIVIDEKLGVAFVSTSDVRAGLGEKRPNADGIYLLELEGPTRLSKLPGAPVEFHPRGISLYRAPDGTLTLFAINHRSDGTSSIDTFEVRRQGNEIGLHEVGSIEGGELVSPSAIAAVDRDRFYVANDHTSRTAFGRMLDDWLILPRANVVYFDGLVFRTVAVRLNAPSGLVLSPNGRFLYVSETFNRRLDSYARRDLSGDLDPLNMLSIPANLGELRFDSTGNIWVAGDRALAMMTDRSRSAPSEIFRVSLSDGISQSASLVYADLGQGIGGASVAAVIGRRMLIGSPLDDKILDCTMRH